jgi:SAM-dependent methyltransferase
MSVDAQTLAAYGERAADYAALGLPRAALADLLVFLGRLPPGGHVLDLGCGPGDAAEVMAARGFAVDAWDASPEMVAMAASRPGVTARQARFDDLDAIAAYDGVWASVSLLHAPRAAFPAHLRRIARALRPGGTLYLAMKTGTGEGRDSLGRFYAYYSGPELFGQLRRAGFRPRLLASGKSVGLAGTLDPFVTVLARGPNRASPQRLQTRKRGQP